MTLPLTVRPRAEADLDGGFGRYEAQLPGLGEAFLRTATACFARIAQHPEAYQEVQRRVRRASLQRFPYGVFYVVPDRRVGGVPRAPPAASLRTLAARAEAEAEWPGLAHEPQYGP